MPTANCYVPLTLKLSGTPSEDDWTALEDALVAQYSRAIQRSLDEITRSRPAVQPGELQEAFEPDRETPDGHLIPSYDQGLPTPVPTDSQGTGVSADSPVDPGQAAQLIREHFADSNGLPAAGVYRGAYLTLAGSSAPEVLYLNELGDRMVRRRLYTRDAKRNQHPVSLDSGSYTLVLSAGEKWGRLYRHGRLVSKVENLDDVELTVTFFVPSDPYEVVVRGGETYTFYPQIEISRVSEAGPTTGSRGVFVANVTIFRRDKDDVWVPLYPLALIYAFVYYGWEINKITRGPGGQGITKRVKVHEVSPDPHNAILTYTWNEDGEYEIRCVASIHSGIYPDASPRPVWDSLPERVEKLEVKQAAILAQLEKAEETLTKPGDARVWATSAQELLDKFDQMLKSEKNEARRRAIEDAIEKLKRHLVGQTAAGPFPIHAIFTDRRTSVTRPLSLFLGPSNEVDESGSVTWLLIDATYPAFYANYHGSGQTVGEAVRQTFETSRTSFRNHYPPGQILANISWPGMEVYGLRPFVFTIETESWQREAYEWLTSAIQGLAMITLAASFVFPPSALLTGAVVVTMVGGATLSVVNIASRVNTGSFEWDAESICDIVNIAASFAFVAGTVARGAAAGISRTIAAGEEITLAKATELAGTVAKLRNFSKAMLYVGLAGDATNGVVLAWDTYRQLRDIDAQMSEGVLDDYVRIYGEKEGRRRFEQERYIRVLSVLARAATNGLLIGLSAKSAHEQLGELGELNPRGIGEPSVRPTTPPRRTVDDLQLGSVPNLTQAERSVLEALAESSWNRIRGYARSNRTDTSVKGKIAEELMVYTPEYADAQQRAIQRAADRGIPETSVRYVQDVEGIAPTAAGQRLQIVDGAFVAVVGDEIHFLAVFESKSPSNLRDLSWTEGGARDLGQIAKDFERLREMPVIVNGQTYQPNKVRVSRRGTDWYGFAPPGEVLSAARQAEILAQFPGFRLFQGPVGDAVLNTIARRILQITPPL